MWLHDGECWGYELALSCTRLGALRSEQLVPSFHLAVIRILDLQPARGATIALVGSLDHLATMPSRSRSQASSAEAYSSLMTLIPYKQIGEPEDIGRVTAFLASDLADYINGTSIFVDCGMCLYPGVATGG